MVSDSDAMLSVSERAVNRKKSSAATTTAAATNAICAGDTVGRLLTASLRGSKAVAVSGLLELFGSEGVKRWGVSLSS